MILFVLGDADDDIDIDSEDEDGDESRSQSDEDSSQSGDVSDNERHRQIGMSLSDLIDMKPTTPSSVSSLCIFLSAYLIVRKSVVKSLNRRVLLLC